MGWSSGGLIFVLKTVAFNGALVMFPLWVAALFLPASLLGLFAWNSPAAPRIWMTVDGLRGDIHCWPANHSTDTGVCFIRRCLASAFRGRQGERRI